MYSSRSSVFRVKKTKKMGKNWKVLSFLIVLTMLLNILYVYDFYNQNLTENSTFNQNNELFEEETTLPELSSELDDILNDPFLKNFSDIWQFFNTNYESNLNLQISTYLRNGDGGGTIIDDKIYPVDNLLLYKSLLKNEVDAYDTYSNYLDLRVSPFWYDGNSQEFDYGFINSVDESDNAVYNDTRYLIDNLAAIDLLIENIGYQINTINIGGQKPADSIEELYDLIGSSIFWDNTYKGFYDHNSTNYKYTESNLYAILISLKIKNLLDNLNINDPLRDQAELLANETMTKLLAKDIWDQTNIGFKYYAKRDWTGGDPGMNYKYLSVNALGIITLIEYWLETGMQTTSKYINYAKLLYDKMEDYMWSPNLGGIYNAYEYSRTRFWGEISPNSLIDLEANALMMYACSRLFEVTGNFTYYERAWEIYETFESEFYDVSVNAYRSSISNPFNDDKDFHANLVLCDAYNKAYELYNKTTLEASYNISGDIPDFIFNQDTLNLTSIYAYKTQIQFYNTTTDVYELKSVVYEITDGEITYLFKKPDNGMLFDTVSTPIISKSTTLIYNITDQISIGNNYYLWMYANTSKLGTAFTLKHFNVISGLVNVGILGLPKTLYQGPTLNVTLQINNTRKDNVMLNVSMGSQDIYNETQLVGLDSLVLTNITFNLTAKLDAKIGTYELIFDFTEGDILYLRIVEIIKIGYSFDYRDFIYESRTVQGGNIQLSLKLINFLPNSSQFLNMSFRGEHLLHNVFEEITLVKNEIRNLYYNLQLSNLIIINSTEITMNIKKGDTIFYNKTFTVQIVPKFEILSVSFPNSVPQGGYADFILVIRNNQKISESFSLYVNGAQVNTNLAGLGPGDNKIITQVIPSIFPYDFQIKAYTFTLRDNQGDIIAQYYYEVALELTTFNLIIFYVLPIIIPIAILLFYKNKEIQRKLLRR